MELPLSLPGLHRKRVIFVSNIDTFFVSHRLTLGVAAQRAGLEVHVAAAPAGGETSIREAGFTFHPLTRLSRKGLRPDEEIGTIADLVALYRTLRPSLVHHITIKPVLYGSWAARVSGVPAVVNAISGLGYVFLARGLGAALRRRAVQVAYRIAFGHPRQRTVFQNPQDLAYFVDAGLLRGDQAVLIRGTGVDPAAFGGRVGRPRSVPVVMLAGRMLRDKGVAEFVAAARRCWAAGAIARFVLVGEPDVGNPASIDPQQLAAWAMDPGVEWWGHRTDMANVLGEATIVCMPSYREGLPRVLVEAAASGLPTIATDVPGCREIVKHGETGLLVPPRDSEALAMAIQSLLVNPSDCARMGANGRKLVEAEFTIDRVAQDTMALYRLLLSADTDLGAGI